MKTVWCLDVLVIVAVTFCMFKCDETVTQPSQHGDWQGSIGLIHTKESILLLRSSALANKPPPGIENFPKDIIPSDSSHSTNHEGIPKRKRKGHRGGLRRRMRRSKALLPLPSILLSNTRSFRPNGKNKISMHSTLMQLLCMNTEMHQFYALQKVGFVTK